MQIDPKLWDTIYPALLRPGMYAEAPEIEDASSIKDWKLRAVNAVIENVRPAPIPIIIHCPRCHRQHFDEPDDNVKSWMEQTGEDASSYPHDDGSWTNPDHTSHKCLHCGTIWRPADVQTCGVSDIKTAGKTDNWTPQSVDFGFPLPYPSVEGTQRDLSLHSLWAVLVKVGMLRRGLSAISGPELVAAASTFCEAEPEGEDNVVGFIEHLQKLSESEDDRRETGYIIDTHDLTLAIEKLSILNAGYQQARRLAQTLHFMHYPKATTWQVQPDLVGVISQIDNMVANLVRKPESTNRPSTRDIPQAIIPPDVELDPKLFAKPGPLQFVPAPAEPRVSWKALTEIILHHCKATDIMGGNASCRVIGADEAANAIIQALITSSAGNFAITGYNGRVHDEYSFIVGSREEKS